MKATAGRVDVWSVRSTESYLRSLDDSILSRAERVRADTFVRRHDQVRYMVAHVVLRTLLSRYTAVSPRDLSFWNEPCSACDELHGRPRVRASDGLQFSLSRSGDVVMIAVSGDRIGVDVERVPSLTEALDLGPVLHPDEWALVQAAPSTQAARVFARIWTRKEAYLKALGVGLNRDLALDYVGVDGVDEGPSGWALEVVPVPEGYAATVASATARAAVFFHGGQVGG